MRRWMIALWLALVVVSVLFVQPRLWAFDRYLRQATDANVPVGPFYDAADAVTEETGLTLRYDEDVKIRKAGTNAWAAKNDANDLIHRANGWYDCLLDETDTGALGPLYLYSPKDANHVGVWHVYEVVTASWYDAMFADGLISKGNLDAALDANLPDGFATVSVTSGNLHAHLKAADDNVVVDANQSDITTTVTALLPSAFNTVGVADGKIDANAPTAAVDANSLFGAETTRGGRTWTLKQILEALLGKR
jgi:hypothetical protein